MSNKEELIEFLKHVDGRILLTKTFRPEYSPGIGRRVFDRVWSVSIEGRILGRSLQC